MSSQQLLSKQNLQLSTRGNLVRIVQTFIRNRLKMLSNTNVVLYVVLASIGIPALTIIVVKWISQIIMNRIGLRIKQLAFYNFRQDGQVNVDLQATMLNVPSWISCIVKFRRPGQMFYNRQGASGSNDLNAVVIASPAMYQADYDGQQKMLNGSSSPQSIPDDDLCMATLAMNPVHVPLGASSSPSEGFSITQNNLIVNVKNRLEFIDFCRQLLTSSHANVDLKCQVDLHVFGLLPVYSLKFNPSNIVMDGMRGLTENVIQSVQVKKGTTQHLELDTKVEIYNPSTCSMSLGKVMFDIHIDRNLLMSQDEDGGGDYDNADDMGDEYSDGGQDDSEFNDYGSDLQYGPVIGSVIIAKMQLVPGWNQLNAKCLFHPPPGYKPALKLLSNHINGVASEVIMMGSQSSLMDFPQYGLDYLSPVFPSLIIPSVMPPLSDVDSKLITRCKLRLWDTFKNPVGNLVGRGLSSLGTVDSAVVIQQPFHDTVSIIWAKGEMYLSQSSSSQQQQKLEEQDLHLSEQQSQQQPLSKGFARKSSIPRLGSSDSVDGMGRSQSRSTGYTQTTKTNSFGSQLQPGMKIGTLDADVRRDRWMKNKTGIEKILERRDQPKQQQYHQQSQLSEETLNAAVSTSFSKDVLQQRKLVRNPTISNASDMDGYETANSGSMFQLDVDDEDANDKLPILESLICVPPNTLVLSPNIPVAISVNASSISAMLSAAVGKLNVDIYLTIGAYIGSYYTEGVDIVQLNVPVDIE
ncbi:hypothetical protein MP228_005696 [Amoeboaphelidium protococcarum]|nr:hypothetical protein MP228_005696 [Amoeboaphelidium protococcarum]